MFRKLKKIFSRRALFLLLSLGISAISLAATPDRSHWPAALQKIPLDRLSSGAVSLLDRNGDLVRQSASAGLQAQVEAFVPVTLDLRVAPNLRLGDDPPQLPPTMRAED